MKRSLWIALGAAVLGCGVVFAIGVIEQAMHPAAELPSLLPEGALLFIEARDFGGLLHDWNASPEKSAWVTSNNYAEFSRSRLFSRLSQAQDEFSTAAGLAADSALLEQVAGKESCLGLYDIGNLEFVYVTRMGQERIESSLLWQTRAKFEQRSEAGTTFYVRKDAQSSRTATFAARDGWLILGTREDLVAGVLDRFAGSSARSVAGEAWYGEAVKQAGERGDLRMVLNLEKIVPSPYFRSYWVQRNITEMKQYASAISDLYRSRDEFREERVLLRRPGTGAKQQGDARPLAALAPEDAAFFSSQALPGAEDALRLLREDLLSPLPRQAEATYRIAPVQAPVTNAGSGTQLDVMIDQAPVVVPAADIYQPLGALLTAAQPDEMLEVFSTRAPRDGVFVSLQTAIVLSAPGGWNETAVDEALSAAIKPRVSASGLGVNWVKRKSAAGEYSALDGAVTLYAEVSGTRLLLANDATLMEKLLARGSDSHPAMDKNNLTYTALFRPAQEQDNFRRLTGQLDLAGHPNSRRESGNRESPAFFSGNTASLGRVFSALDSEQVDERDLGDKLKQTVTYRWKH